MWNIPSVSKEWKKCGEKRGKVRISHDTNHRPYLSRVELRVCVCAGVFVCVSRMHVDIIFVASQLVFLLNKKHV